MKEPKSAQGRLLMHQKQLGELVDNIAREGMVVNVHYVPEGRETAAAGQHVVAVWPIEQWKSFYQGGDRERLIGDTDTLAALAAREGIAKRLKQIETTLSEVRELIRAEAARTTT